MANNDIMEMKRATRMSEFWSRFMRELILLDGGTDQLDDLSEDDWEDLARVAATIASNGTIGKSIGSYPITPYTRSLEEVKALPGWNRFSGNITSANFPPPEEGDEDAVIKLIQFDDRGTTALRERQLAAKKLSKPDIHHQRRFAMQHPAAWVNKKVVFLGATWEHPNGEPQVGCLCGLNGERHFDLYWDNPKEPWSSDWFFAGVCQPVPLSSGKLGICA